ncbi:MAG: peptidase C15 [Phormidesmis sp.]
MKTAPILITSFQPWRAHQPTNSSDELIAELYRQRQLSDDVVWLRQVPVSFQMAPIQVISEIYRVRPRLVICCGMAESRACLSLEQQAKGPHQVLTTAINLPDLLVGTSLTEISDDAGSYVCNHLYYSVLEFIDRATIDTVSLFIHVPILRSGNRRAIIRDFLHIYSMLATRTN